MGWKAFIVVALGCTGCFEREVVGGHPDARGLDADAHFDGPVDGAQGTVDASRPPPCNVTTGLGVGLLGFWPLDGNGLDRSPAQRDLDVDNQVSFVSGLRGQAAKMSGGTDSGPSRPVDDAVLDLQSDFTMQAWVYFESSSGNQAILDKFSGGAGPGWTLVWLASSQYQFAVGNSAHMIVINELSPVMAQPNQSWTHVVVRRQTSTSVLQLFVNDVSVASMTTTTALGVTTQPFGIGHRPGVVGMQGRIDDAAIWSRALTDTEIATLYNGGLGAAACQ